MKNHIMMAMAEAPSPPCNQAGCNCSLSQLLRRAIDLIDPPRPSITGADNDGAADEDACTDHVVSEDTPNKASPSPPEPASPDNNLVPLSPPNGNIDDTLIESPPAKKKVRFHESLCANSEDLSTDLTAKISAEIDITDTDISSLLNDVDSSSSNHEQHESAKKKVRFHESCALPKRVVSAADAIQAYDLLMHAASLASSSSAFMNSDELVGDVNSLSWETLQQMVDIYRALHITSCLLIELLPLDLLNDTSLELEGESIEDGTQPNKTNNIQQQFVIQSMGSQQQPTPAPCSSQQEGKTEEGEVDHSSTSSKLVPNLSPEIVETLLSTSRKSILLLQALERMCAAKTVAQRHVTSTKGNSQQYKNVYSPSGSCSFIPKPVSLFYTRGDDIHDYDRSTSDLYTNYDWHDDGYLPLPFSWVNNEGKGPNVGNKDANNAAVEETSQTVANNGNEVVSNILKECLYRPQHYTDPPSSRHQKSAWTRDWICGDRIISLRLEDYQYHDQEGGDYFVGQNYLVGGFDLTDEQHDSADNVKNGGSMYEANVSNITGNQSTQQLDQRVGNISEFCHNETEDNDINGVEGEGSLILDLTPEALAEEEDHLINIMVPTEATTSSAQINSHQNNGQQLHAQATAKLSNKERAAKEREKRKQKRHRQKAAQQFNKVDSSSGGSAMGKVDQNVHVKEGFLCIVCNDDEAGNSHDNLFQYLGMKTGGSTNATKSVRVYARLQPSGILSLEVCTICRRPSLENDDNNMVEPLPTRVRYLDFIIGAKTKCQPYMPNEASSFHFRVECVQFLGSSSLCQWLEKDHDAGVGAKSVGHTPYNTATLSFSVDEKAGGALVDGFEWVTALAGAANEATVLQERIHLEWS